MRTTRLFLILSILLVMLTTVVNAQDDEAITLTYWDWWVTQADAIDETIAAFEAEHPNITIEKTTQSDYDNLINLAFESDNAPDVYMIPNNAPISVMVENGRLMPLNEFEGFDAFVGQFPETRFVEGLNVLDGAYYTLDPFATTPWLQMYVNLNLYEAAGLVDADGNPMLPETLDEMIANSQAIREATDAYGFGFSGTQDWAVWWWWWGCQFTEPIFYDGFPSGWNPVTGQFEWSSNACVSTLVDNLLMIRDEDLLLPDTFMIDDEQARAFFAEDQFAHLIGGTWIMPGWSDTHPDFSNYTAIPFPLVGQEEIGGYFHTAGGGRWLGINPNTEHAEAAWEFYQFMHSETFGANWAETGNGLALTTPGEVSDYDAFTPAWQNIFGMADLVVNTPQPTVTNPDTTQVEVTLVGPWEGQVLLGILTGQLDDVDAALADLDERYMAALEQGIADAVADGADVSIDDYIFADWNPLESYTSE